MHSDFPLFDNDKYKTEGIAQYVDKLLIEKKINSGHTFFYNKDFMSISLSYKTGKFKKYS